MLYKSSLTDALNIFKRAHNVYIVYTCRQPRATIKTFDAGETCYLDRGALRHDNGNLLKLGHSSHERLDNTDGLTHRMSQPNL
jgi:hypothetical protein